MKKNISTHSLAFVLVLFGIWRTLLFAVSFVADSFLKYQPSFPYADALLLNRNLPRWLASWANFDGVHYITIVEKGYMGTGLIQAFFPLYPLFTWLFHTLFIDTVIAGILVSTICGLLFIATFYAYLSQKISVPQAKWIILTTLLFPTSFFLGAMYTESLFLLLILTSLWAGQQKKWLLAAVLAALASATRLVGIFLVPALLFELLQSHLENSAPQKNSLKKLLTTSFWLAFGKKHTLTVLTVLSASLGLLAYMWYLQVYFHDPLYFYHVQSEFGGGRQESLILLPQVLWRYLKILVTTRPFDLKYFAYFQELLATLFTFLIIALSAKKARWSWTTFSLLALILPTLTGTLSSMPRYILVALPLYVYLGKLVATKSPIGKLWLVVSTLLLLINTLLFIQGYWIA